jgi:hypothetical protein
MAPPKAERAAGTSARALENTRSQADHGPKFLHPLAPLGARSRASAGQRRRVPNLKG